MTRTCYTRAVGAGILAVCALIATLGVLDENMLSTRESVAKDEDLAGDGLLRAQAQALDKQRELEGKGQNMAQVDNMMNSWSADMPKEDEEFTKTLEAQGPQKNDLDVALSPNKLGLIKYHDGKAYFSPPDMDLVQVDDWEPHGQEELDDAIAAAKKDDEKAEAKSDDLKGDSLLSAVGIKDDTAEKKSDYLMSPEDAFETVFVQESSSADDGAWEPKGQEGLADDIADVKQEQEDAGVKADGLKGTGLLSSVGIEGDEPAEETFLIQDTADWVPTGQDGLSDDIAMATESDEQDRAKADGLEGNTILSAGGFEDDSPETFFLQKQESKDGVRDWNPKGQKIDDVPYEEEDDKEKPWNKPDDGVYGDDILSAVEMGDHKKADDEATELGTIKADDLDIDDMLSSIGRALMDIDWQYVLVDKQPRSI